MRNTIDLWSGQRKCILCLTDEDVKLMVDVYESKQRDPMEVINKKYVEFIRMCHHKKERVDYGKERR